MTFQGNIRGGERKKGRKGEGEKEEKEKLFCRWIFSAGYFE